MKQLLLIIISLALISQISFSQDKKVYQLYSSEGVPVTYDEMVKQLRTADLVFFGELHNNAISHWLELEVTESLYDINQKDLILSAEMFESDNQLIVDEYLSGLIPKTRFEAECRLWPNYKTDYKPLMEFAKEKGLQFVAANVPRRYANIVSKGGFEILNSVSVMGKSYLPPLPIEYDPEVPCYKNMMNMGGGGMPAHVTANLPKAQAVKDATMAFFIMKSFETGKQVLHFNGSYHSMNHEGTVWYINQMMPGLNIQVIHTVSQADIYLLEDENKGAGDFILVVDEEMTNTY
ncbi:MAG: ChaN family lipoprotein [Bacteroidales bacterium]|nr:ChaN family lipoprotein [Bacteroidales bacterium]